MNKRIVLAFFTCMGLFAACTSDIVTIAEPTPCEIAGDVTYDNQIQTIIDTNCNDGSCHGGGAPGNYTTLAGMQDVITNGKFEERVFTLKDDPNMGMPPNYAQNSPMDLTDEELELLQCWADAGFPEN